MRLIGKLLLLALPAVALLLPATTTASVYLVWDGGAEPTPYTAFNFSDDDIYAMIFPHNPATEAYTTNGWTAAVVSRAEWEGGIFTFTDAFGWTPPAPSNIPWDIAFQNGPDQNQVVAYWVGSGTPSPLLRQETLSGFWTDVPPDGEWAGIALDVNGNYIPIAVSGVPLPLPAFLLFSGVAWLLVIARSGHAAT